MSVKMSLDFCEQTKQKQTHRHRKQNLVTRVGVELGHQIGEGD